MVPSEADRSAGSTEPQLCNKSVTLQICRHRRNWQWNPAMPALHEARTVLFARMREESLSRDRAQIARSSHSRDLRTLARSSHSRDHSICARVARTAGITPSETADPAVRMFVGQRVSAQDLQACMKRRPSAHVSIARAPHPRENSECAVAAPPSQQLRQPTFTCSA